MTTLSDLRAEVKRLRRNATRKVARLKRVNGVDISGLPIDVRRPLKSEDRYNTSSLLAYKRQLESFLSRKNQYVPDAHKRPIPKAKFDRYDRLQKQRKKTIEGQFGGRYNSIKLPSGETISERNARLTPRFPVMGGAATHRITGDTYRRPHNIASEDALDKLIKKYEKESGKDFLNRNLESARASVDAMLNYLGDDEIRKSVESMSDDQFMLWWYYGGGAESLSTEYDFEKLMEADPRKSFLSEGRQLRREMVEDSVKWAKKVIR